MVVLVQDVCGFWCVFAVRRRDKSLVQCDVCGVDVVRLSRFGGVDVCSFGVLWVLCVL